MTQIDTYHPNAKRYDAGMAYRRTGNSGLRLPAITLGLWHNFGDATSMQTQRDMLRTAFDLAKGASSKDGMLLEVIPTRGMVNRATVVEQPSSVSKLSEERSLDPLE